MEEAILEHAIADVDALQEVPLGDAVPIPKVERDLAIRLREESSGSETIYFSFLLRLIGTLGGGVHPWMWNEYDTGALNSIFKKNSSLTPDI